MLTWKGCEEAFRGLEMSWEVICLVVWQWWGRGSVHQLHSVVIPQSLVQNPASEREYGQREEVSLISMYKDD